MVAEPCLNPNEIALQLFEDKLCGFFISDVERDGGDEFFCDDRGIATCIRIDFAVSDRVV